MLLCLEIMKLVFECYRSSQLRAGIEFQKRHSCDLLKNAAIAETLGKGLLYILWHVRSFNHVIFYHLIILLCWLFEEYA